MFSLFLTDPAEIIHIRPVEDGKSEYYVHYHGCKLPSFYFQAVVPRIFAQNVSENSMKRRQRSFKTCALTKS